MRDDVEGLPDLLTVAEFARWARVGRNQAYDAIKRGDVPTVRFGRTIRVPKTALLRMLEGNDDE